MGNNKQQHTQEPWSYNEHTFRIWANGLEGNKYDGNDPIVCNMSRQHMSIEELKANAERIVACVNACEGMVNPEAEILALRNALESFRKRAHDAEMELEEVIKQRDAAQCNLADMADELDSAMLKRGLMAKSLTYKIHYLNANNNFKETIMKFTSYDEAMEWGSKNITNFNTDLIRPTQRLVVIDEHTLAIITGDSDLCTVLASSPLRGATSSSPLSSMDPVYHKNKTVRLASEKDFQAFRVDFTAYNNPNEYEYEQA